MFFVNDVWVQVDRYPDGTPRMNIGEVPDGAIIEWYFEKDEEMILFFIVSHLKERFAVKRLTLRMPYIPHARMDRVKDEKEVFTLKYFCEFINSMGFEKVIVRDPHSKVSLDLLERAVQEPIGESIKGLANRLLDPKKDMIFYPDEGSRKRYSGMVDFPCAYGVKKRDWDTGRISGLDAEGKIPAAPFDALIVDDISSYGGTFLLSAKKLKELGADKIYLYITHCENSILEGELINSGLLERIFTTRSIYSGNNKLIEVLGGRNDE